MHDQVLSRAFIHVIRVNLWRQSKRRLYKLHLYYSQEELVYDPVFVRTDRDLVVCVTAAPRSCSGTTATASLAIANTGGDCEPIAHARSITDTT
jgi:hypothetical protein